MQRRMQKYKDVKADRFRETFFQANEDELREWKEASREQEFDRFAHDIISDIVFHSDEDKDVRHQPSWRSEVATKILDLVDSMAGKIYPDTAKREIHNRKPRPDQIAFLQQDHLAAAVDATLLEECATEECDDEDATAMSDASSTAPNSGRKRAARFWVSPRTHPRTHAR